MDMCTAYQVFGKTKIWLGIRRHPVPLNKNTLGAQEQLERCQGSLPIRRAQTRFACGVGAVWLIATGLAFYFGATNLGYILGFALVSLSVLVSTTDICIASIIYNALFFRSQTN